MRGNMQKNRNAKKIDKIIIIVAIAITALLVIVINLVGSPMGKKDNSFTDKDKPKVSASDSKRMDNLAKSEVSSETETSATSSTASDAGETTKKSEETTGKEEKNEIKTNPRNVKEAEEVEKNAKKKVYLTFDDGPSHNTNRILDILAQYKVKATFFNMVTDVPEYLEAQKREWEEGHTIGIHTVNHDYKELYSSLDAWKKDVLGEHQFLREQLGIDSRYYRFPGGSSNELAAQYGTDINKCIAWLNNNNFKYFDWNSENGDGRGMAKTPQMCIDNINATIYDNGDGYIILMHDATNKNPTVEALPKVIEELRDRGFTLCQITDNTIPVHHR